MTYASAVAVSKSKFGAALALKMQTWKTQEALKPNQAISTAHKSMPAFDLIAQSRLSTTKTATAAWSELAHLSVLYVRTDLQDHNDSASELCFDTKKLSYVRLQTWQEYTNL